MAGGKSDAGPQKGNGVDYEEKCKRLEQEVSVLQQQLQTLMSSTAVYMNSVSQRAAAEGEESVALRQLSQVLQAVAPKVESA